MKENSLCRFFLVLLFSIFLAAGCKIVFVDTLPETPKKTETNKPEDDNPDSSDPEDEEEDPEDSPDNGDDFEWNFGL